MNLPPFRLMALTNECHGNNKTTGPIYGKDEHHHDLILLDTHVDNNSNTKKNASAKAEASGAIGLLGFLCHYDAANLPTDLSDPVAAFNDSTCFTLDDIEVYSAVPVTFRVLDASLLANAHFVAEANYTGVHIGDKWYIPFSPPPNNYMVLTDKTVIEGEITSTCSWTYNLLFPNF